MASGPRQRKTIRKSSITIIAMREASVNAVAGLARGLWLGYLTLGAYLFIAVGSVTHRQLFLETPIRLPILNVDLPLIGFFAIAPLFFLVNHFYLLLTLLSLGRRIAEYNDVLAKENLVPEAGNEVRRKLDSFVIVLALAGTQEERTGRTSYMLRTIAWLTVVFTPVILLLFMQLTFLPYQLAWVTWLHRGVLILDLALLWVFWQTIRAGEKGLPVPMFWHKPAAGLSPCLVGLFSIFIATFPGESHDQNGPAMERWIPYWSEKRAVFGRKNNPHPNGSSPYELLFLGDVDTVTGKRKSLWSNTLVLPGEDFVDDEKLEKITWRAKKDGKKPFEGERTKRIRGRDLRGAVLSLADLRYTDFTGAKLQGANLFRAELQGADLLRAQMQGANLGGAQMQGANLFGAQIWQVKPVVKAQIEAADLSGIALTPSDPQALLKMLAELKDEAVRKRVETRLESLLDLHKFAAWAGSPERQAWKKISKSPKPAPADLSDFLSSLACNDATGGYIVKGIARRITDLFEKNTAYAKLTAKALLDKETCSPTKHLSEETLAVLRKIAGSDPEKPEAKAVR